MRVIAIGTRNAWSVEHRSLTGTYNFGAPGKVKREQADPSDTEDDVPMYAIYHDPREHDHELVELTWAEYCDSGFTDAWFEVGPRCNKQKITCLINLADNRCLVSPSGDEWVPVELSQIAFGTEDIVEGLQYIDTGGLQCEVVPINDAITTAFYNLLCASQGFNQQ